MFTIRVSVHTFFFFSRELRTLENNSATGFLDFCKCHSQKKKIYEMQDPGLYGKNKDFFWEGS